MRVDAPHIFEPHSWRCDQIVDDSQAGFAHNPQIVFEQQVIVLMDGAEERVFNRRQAVIARTAFDRREHLFKSFAGDKLDFMAEQFARSLATERSGFTLKRDAWIL